MISVSLDDALSQRARGELVCAGQQVSVAAGFLKRLSGSLVSFCEALASRGRYIGDVPKVKPLNGEFFRGGAGQSAAAWNAILHLVLFGDRARFVYKLELLAETFTRIEHDFANSAGEIAASGSGQAFARWAALDSLHYDFNTCLRETEVTFKSFLRALPMDQLSSFSGEFEEGAPLSGNLRPHPQFSRASA